MIQEMNEMEEVLRFFREYDQLSITAHVFSVIFGMGAALVSDVLFNVYIKDKKINPTENKTLRVLSQIIWISLVFIALSGLAIFLSDPLKYAESPKFLVKIAIFFVIILNGYIFWKFIHKSLRKINFTDTNSHHKYVRIRKLSFALGSVSVVSWILVFILGSAQSMVLSFNVAMGIYVAIVICAIIASQIIEYTITHKKSH